MRAHKASLNNTQTGQQGSKLLLTGQELAMWLWQATPTQQSPSVDAFISQDYEVAGYVVSGQAELHVDGKVIVLEPGDSWVVPTGALHAYRVLEPLTAIRTNHPPVGYVY